MPFSILNLSSDSPRLFQFLIVAGSAENETNSNSGLLGAPFSFISLNQKFIRNSRHLYLNGPRYDTNAVLRTQSPGNWPYPTSILRTASLHFFFVSAKSSISFVARSKLYFNSSTYFKIFLLFFNKCIVVQFPNEIKCIDLLWWLDFLFYEIFRHVRVFAFPEDFHFPLDFFPLFPKLIALLWPSPSLYPLTPFSVLQFWFENVFTVKIFIGRFTVKTPYLYILAYFSIAMTHMPKYLAAIDREPIFSKLNSGFFTYKSICLRTLSVIWSLSKSFNWNKNF